MGWLFGNDKEEINQDVIDKADINRLKVLALQARLPLEEYIKEINKQIAIERGKQLLEDLSTRHKVISINDGVDTIHIIPEELETDNIKQYLVK
ncbi:hypothetical protein QNF09_000356 [Vibrio alginolyticus]|nr:hypothetical protein [Vibrio alginolyticus]